MNRGIDMKDYIILFSGAFMAGALLLSPLLLLIGA
jgi:uncharacterized metal-binding protein